MKRWFTLALVLLVALSFGLYRYRRTEKRADPATLAATPDPATGHDSCQKKERCLVAYLAPWCPYCKRMVPRLEQMVQRAATSADAGVRVIVGGGKPADNEGLAAKFGASGVVDASDEHAQRLQITAYPSFFLLDARERVVADGEQALHWAFTKFPDR